MEVKKPIVMHVNGYEMHLRSLIIRKNFKELDYLEKWFGVPKYCIYIGTNKKTGIIYYIGKGVFINGKGHECRVFLHRGDLLAATINPEEWCCEILFDGLTEKQAYAAEAYLIAICSRSRSKRGQKVGDADSLINKKKETKHEQLIEKYLKLDGNNNGKALIREINRN